MFLFVNTLMTSYPIVTAMWKITLYFIIAVIEKVGCQHRLKPL